MLLLIADPLRPAGRRREQHLEQLHRRAVGRVAEEERRLSPSLSPFPLFSRIADEGGLAAQPLGRLIRIKVVASSSLSSRAGGGGVGSKM